MCGILASFDPKGESQPHFAKALNYLAHRGPDDSGIYRSSCQRLYLGHRLLRIVDPQGGLQPIGNSRGDIYAVVNGEIYDDEVLRKELQAKGYLFTTSSDAEILIHLYAEYGLQCLDKINGEFAFVLWDESHQRIFAARDRFGIKPLYFTKHKGGLLVASECKALFALGVPMKWDSQTLRHVFSHQYPLPEQSLFADINALPPGHLLIYEDGVLDCQSYWDIPYAPNHSSPDDFWTLLCRAVSRRLRANCKRAVYLSGGIDSATILAISSQYTTTPLDSYTVQFWNTSYDESALAAEIAARFNSRHHRVPVSQRDIITNFEDAVWFGECFAINGQLPAKFILSKRVQADGVKVVLSGEGADESLLGYPHLKQDWIHHYGQSELQQRLDNENVKARGVFLPQGKPQKGIPTFLQAKQEFGTFIHRLMYPQAAADILRNPPVDTVLQRFQRPSNPVYRASHMWTKLSLAGYILRGIGDGMEMAHGVEGRPPFLDHELFAFCTQLPMEQKIQAGTEKYILREKMKELLPLSLCNRPKHPFISPPIDVFAHDYGYRFLQDVLRSSLLHDIPFIDPKRVNAYLDTLHRDGANRHTYNEAPLMLLLSAALMQNRLNHFRRELQ